MKIGNLGFSLERVTRSTRATRMQIFFFEARARGDGSPANVKPSRSLRCDRCVMRRGKCCENERAVAHSHLTRCDTARGSRGTGGPRANANLPDRPFSTDETDRTAVGEQVLTPSLSPFHPRRRSHQLPSPYPRSTSRRASPFTPGLIPGPDRRGQDPVESDTCRTLYLHAYQRFSLRPDAFIARSRM